MPILELSQRTVNLIKSSQVITSISSIVKELVENSLDAKATVISVKIENYGFDKLEVKDNGCGIKEVDVDFIAKPHFTSKIESFEDLNNLSTYGFRGEALSSLCAVSELFVSTKSEKDSFGFTYSFDCNGNIIEKKPAAITTGTSIIVKNLYKKIAVRRQYYSNNRRRREELKKVENIIMSFALIKPEIHITLYHEKCVIFQKPSADFATCVHSVFKDSSKRMVLKQANSNNIKLQLFLPKQKENDCSLSSPDKLFIFVNERPISHKSIEKLVKAYYSQKSEGAHGRYPIGVVILTISPDSIDVNLEPNKTRVYFHDEKLILSEIENILSNFYGPLLHSSNENKLSLSSDDHLPCTFANSLPCEEFTSDSHVEKGDFSVKKVENTNKIVNFCDKNDLSQNVVSNKVPKDFSYSSENDLPQNVIGNKVPKDFSYSSENDIPHNVIGNKVTEVSVSLGRTITNMEHCNFVNKTAESNDQNENLFNKTVLPIQKFDFCSNSLVENNTKIETLPIIEPSPLEKCGKSQKFFNENNFEKVHINNDCGSLEQLHSKDDCGSFEKVHSKGDCRSFEKVHNKDDCISFEKVHSKDNCGSLEQLHSKDDCRSFEKVHNKDDCGSFEKVHSKDDCRSFEKVHSKDNCESLTSEKSDKFISIKSNENNVEENSPWSMGRLLKNDKNIQSVEILQPPNVFTKPGNECDYSKRKCENSSDVESSKMKKFKIGFGNNLNSVLPETIVTKTESAFSLFAKSLKMQVIEENPGADFTVIAQELSNKWKNADPETKRKFEEMAQKYKLEKEKLASKENIPQIVSKEHQQKLHHIENKTCSKSKKHVKDVEVKLQSIQKTRPWQNRSKAVQFIFEKLRTKMQRKRMLEIPSESVIGSLKGVNGWIYRIKNSICAFNASRMNEIILFKSLVGSFSIPVIKLEEPLIINSSNLGVDNWEMLLSLNHKASSVTNEYVVIDSRINSNGFKISFCKDNDYPKFSQGEITAVVDSIQDYGIRELKEILSKLINKPNLTLEESRPSVLHTWFYEQSLRMGRAAPHVRDLSILIEKLNMWHKLDPQSLGNSNLKCLHNMPIFEILKSL